MNNSYKEFEYINVIGAGLAGSEAAYQLAKNGYRVKLYEMRPKKNTVAHQTSGFAELVCSNSLRGSSLENAVGVLKEEMRMMDSLIMKAADATKIEAGGALAVDRILFSEYITKAIINNPLIEVINEEVTDIPKGPTIIATGPLTSGKLYESIQKLIKETQLYFFDAIAPIVTSDSINYDKVYLASRYNKGEPAYINCPMNKEEFTRFYDFLINAECVEPKDYELKIFEGCMPIEEIARRGPQTLLFGPMKPVGLDDPKTGRYPYAVVQLRQDNVAKTLYNIVGFQTHLKYGEQKKLLELIPGLEKAEIYRYGVMHRNTYICSPKLLNPGYQFKDEKYLFFAGQITGVEGYVESASSGLVAGINMVRIIEGKPLMYLNPATATGALALYVTNPLNNEFIPMNVNFGLFKGFDKRIPKRLRKINLGKRAIEEMQKIIYQDYYENVIYDQHLHTKYSADSKTDLEDYFKEAYKRHVSYLVTTDHTDFDMASNHVDWCCDYLKLKEELQVLAMKYPNITPLLGIEVGFRLDKIERINEVIAAYPFDIINLSVHDNGVIDYYKTEDFNKYGLDNVLEIYFNNLINALNNFDNFDVLSHFDYGFKTAKKLNPNLNINNYLNYLEIIFKLVIEKNKALEINLKVQESINDINHLKTILQLYRDLGGTKLTLSSDAHVANLYLSNYEVYLDVIKEMGFKYLCFYQKRQEIHFAI